MERLNLLRIRLTIAVVALAVAVIGMIFIAVINKNVGYFHAEQKVQDKYAYGRNSWMHARRNCRSGKKS